MSALPPALAKAATERLDESLGFLVRTSFRAMVRALARELQPHGVSTAEWSALRVLWRGDGISQVELAERMGVERGSLTRVLAGLEAHGLLRREPDGADGRKLRLHLSPTGRALEPVLLPCGIAANERATAGLTQAEVDTARRVLHRLVTNLES